MSMFRRKLLALYVNSSIAGSPAIKKDANGDVTSYENTTTVEVSAGTEINTEFIPFDGKNWELHINAYFPWSIQTGSMPTLFGCMESVSPWKGLTVRYESGQLYCIFNNASTKHYYKLSADSSGNVDIYITYSDGAVNATNNSTSFMSNVSIGNLALEDLELVLMCDTEGLNRYGTGTIYDFYIKAV